MISEWLVKRMYEIANINPRESLKKGTTAKKVPMDQLIPFCRDIPTYQEAIYEGGSKFRNGDTIMARITPCLENGKIAKVNILNENEIGFGSTEYIVFRAKDNVNEDYLYYLVCSSIVRDPAIQSMVGSSGRQHVQIDVLQNLEILVPSKKEQNKIGSILKAIDDKIDINTKINRNLSEQAETLFRSWFEAYEPWNGEMPTDWRQGALGDFVTIKRGGSPRPIQEYLSDEGLRWLKISDVSGLQSPYVLEIAEHIIEEGLKKTVYLEAGSLVLSNSATPGIPKILDVDSCIHDGWLYFPESQLSNYFLYLFYKSIRPKLVALGNGSVFTNLKTDILKGYSFSKPDDDTLYKFDKIVAPMFRMMREVARENQRLSEVRDSLLPKLMSGELDISDLNI